MCEKGKSSIPGWEPFLKSLLIKLFRNFNNLTVAVIALLSFLYFRDTRCQKPLYSLAFGSHCFFILWHALEQSEASTQCQSIPGYGKF